MQGLPWQAIGVHTARVAVTPKILHLGILPRSDRDGLQIHMVSEQRHTGGDRGAGPLTGDTDTRSTTAK